MDDFISYAQGEEGLGESSALKIYSGAKFCMFVHKQDQFQQIIQVTCRWDVRSGLHIKYLDYVIYIQYFKKDSIKDTFAEVGQSSQYSHHRGKYCK